MSKSERLTEEHIRALIDAIPKPDYRVKFEARFWSKVEKTEGCWIWKGAKVPKGYGEFWVLSQNARAHRIAYELNKGQIPDGLELDHLCRNPACVNPEHLEAVTTAEHAKRGIRIPHPKKACINGHELSEDNLEEWAIKRSLRRCLTCRRERDRESHYQGYWQKKLGISPAIERK